MKKNVRIPSSMASWAVVLILVAIAAVLSYRFSDRIYPVFVRTYYRLVHTDGYNMLYARAQELYSRKQYGAFERLARDLTYAWPKKRSVRLLLGRYYVNNGRIREGTSLISGSLAFDSSDLESLEELLPVLHRAGLHGDIRSIMREYDPGIFSSNGSILFYYGHALFMTGRYEQALEVLSRVRSFSVRPEYLQTLALTYEKLALQADDENMMTYLDNAAVYIEMAYRQSGRDDSVRADYLRILGKTGQHEKAVQAITR